MAKKKKDTDLLEEDEVNPDLAALNDYLDSDESNPLANEQQEFVLPADGSVQLAYDYANNPVYVEYDYNNNQYVDHFTKGILDISTLHDYDGYPFYFFAEDAAAAQSNYAPAGDYASVGDVKQALNDIENNDVDSMISTDNINTSEEDSDDTQKQENVVSEVNVVKENVSVDTSPILPKEKESSDVLEKSESVSEQNVSAENLNPSETPVDQQASEAQNKNDVPSISPVNPAVGNNLTRELSDESPTIDLEYEDAADIKAPKASEQIQSQVTDNAKSDLPVNDVSEKINEKLSLDKTKEGLPVNSVRFTDDNFSKVDDESLAGPASVKLNGFTKVFNDETKKIEETPVDPLIKNKAYQRIKKFRESLISQTDNASLKKVFESIARNEHPTLDKFALFKMDFIQSSFTSILAQLIEKINLRKKEIVNIYEKTIQSVKSVVNSILRQNEEYKKSLNKNVKYVLEKQDAIVSALSTGFKDKSVREMSAGIDYDGLKIAHLNCWTIYENMLNNMNRIRNLEILNISIQKYYHSILIILDNDKKLVEDVNRRIIHNYIEMSRMTVQKVKDSASLKGNDGAYNLTRFKEYARNFMFDVNNKLNKIDITNARPVDTENKYAFLNELDLPNVPSSRRNSYAGSLDTRSRSLGDVVWNSFKQSRDTGMLDSNNSNSFSNGNSEFMLKKRRDSLSPLSKKNRLDRIAIRRKYLRGRLS